MDQTCVIILRDPGLRVADIEERVQRGTVVGELRVRCAQRFAVDGRALRFFHNGALLRDSDEAVRGGEQTTLYVVGLPTTSKQTQTKAPRQQQQDEQHTEEEEEDQQQEEDEGEEEDEEEKQQPAAQQQEDELEAQAQQREREALHAAPAAPARDPWSQISLLFRLAVVVVIMAQGGDSTRALLLVVAAFFIYLWQTQKPELGMFPYVWRAPEEPRAGIVTELHDLFVPLVLSLLPTWSTDAFINRGQVDPVPHLVDEDEDDDEE